MLSIRKRLKSVYKKIKISTLFIYLVIFFLMPIICKAESINQINNKEELSVYLVKKNLNLIEDQTLFENKWFEQYAQEHPRREQALSAWVYLEKIYKLDANGELKLVIKSNF